MNYSALAMLKFCFRRRNKVFLPWKQNVSVLEIFRNTLIVSMLNTFLSVNKLDKMKKVYVKSKRCMLYTPYKHLIINKIA